MNSAGRVSQPGPRERLLAAIPLNERRMQLAGISTAVLEGGEGPPIVLLHDPGEFVAVWTRVIPQLARTHRVVAPDLPGHGASDVGDAPIDVGRISARGLIWSRTVPPAAKFALALIGFLMRPNARTQERVFRGCFVDLDGLRATAGRYTSLKTLPTIQPTKSPRRLFALCG